MALISGSEAYIGKIAWTADGPIALDVGESVESVKLVALVLALGKRNTPFPESGPRYDFEGNNSWVD